MVSRALFVSRIKHLSHRDDGEYSRLYFGNEFCQNLLPTRATLEKVLSEIKDRGLGFTLVTPFVTDSGMARIQRLLTFLSRSLDDHEVVVNDLGVLHMINRELGADRPALLLGRCQTKLKRGPRLVNVKGELPAAAWDHFQRTNIDTPFFTEFLARMGVSRVELDNPLQGVNRDSLAEEIKLKGSLYYPYVYVSTTRYCQFVDLEDEDRSPRKIDPECKKECSPFLLSLKSRQMNEDLLLAGNTVFYRNDRLPENNHPTIYDRVVFQPEVPM